MGILGNVNHVRGCKWQTGMNICIWFIYDLKHIPRKPQWYQLQSCGAASILCQITCKKTLVVLTPTGLDHFYKWQTRFWKCYRDWHVSNVKKKSCCRITFALKLAGGESLQKTTEEVIWESGAWCCIKDVTNNVWRLNCWNKMFYSSKLS